MTRVVGPRRLWREGNMHRWLRSDLNFRLATQALAIMRRHSPQMHDPNVFDEFYRAFKEELLRFEAEDEVVPSRWTVFIPSEATRNRILHVASYSLGRAAGLGFLGLGTLAQRSETERSDGERSGASVPRPTAKSPSLPSLASWPLGRSSFCPGRFLAAVDRPRRSIPQSLMRAPMAVVAKPRLQPSI